MTFDLEAARALHDRAEYSPEYCGTCGDMNTSSVSWPCATAIALGATGRTEWEGPMPTGIRVHFDTEPLPATTYRIHDAVDTCDAVRGPGDGGYTGPRIAADNPCILLNNHPGAHADRDSDRWEQQPDEPEADPWPNAADPCPEQSITGITDKHCIQHRGHEGPHYFAWPDDYTPCRTPGPRPNTPSFCSLGTGHRDAHRNLNGVAWSADERTLGHITPGTVRVTKLHPDGTLAGEPVTVPGILNVQINTAPDDWRCDRARDGWRCNRPTGHTPGHNFVPPPNYTQWLNAENPCTVDNTHPGRRCVFTHDHIDHHHYGDTDTYTPCYTAGGPQPACILDATHIGFHRNLSGGNL